MPPKTHALAQLQKKKEAVSGTLYRDGSTLIRIKLSKEHTCCDGPPTPLTGPASPAGAWAIGAPAGTPLPAALPTPGPPATPARGTLAMPVYNKIQRLRLAILKTIWLQHNAWQKVCVTYIFRRWSFNSHGDQILSSEQHQTQHSLLFPLWLLGIFGPMK